VASVVAALGTGFFLIPYMGVNRLIASCGAALIGIGLLAFWLGRRDGRGSASANVLALLLPLGLGALAAVLPVERVGYHRELAFLEQSAYADIRVVDWEESRILLIDGGTHTIVDRNTFHSVFPYAMVMDIPKYLFEKPGDAVLVGLGGGSVARSYYRAGWKMDSVEIDPVVARVAEEYFSCDPESSGVHVMDGRQFFLTTDRTWDLVLMDAFGSSSIPFHLVTAESFALVKAHLRPGGVLAMNIEARTWHDILVHSLAATLRTQFTHVVALPLAEPPNTLGNLILLASDRPMEIEDGAFGNPAELLAFPYQHMTVVERNHAWDNRFEPSIEGMPVLTDDKNPVDLWAEAINWRARAHMHREHPWNYLIY
jgi:spermidine synthase